MSVGALKLSKIETIQATLCNQLGDGSLTYFAVLGDLNPSSNQQAVLDTSWICSIITGEEIIISTLGLILKITSGLTFLSTATKLNCFRLNSS